MKVLTILFMFILPVNSIAQQKVDNIHFNKVNNTEKIKKDSIDLNNYEYISYKNPLYAIFLAAVPGYILRGIGHYYAGCPKTGIGLFSVTAISMLATKDSPSYVAGWYVFFITWGYDILASPFICLDNNKKLQKSISIRPFYKNNQFVNQYGIQLSYKF